MEIQSIINQHSNSYSKIKTLNHSNSTVETKRILKEYSDLINPDYTPWFAKRLRELGEARFTTLAVKARTSDTPKFLFRWMLDNHEIVV